MMRKGLTKPHFGRIVIISEETLPPGGVFAFKDPNMATVHITFGGAMGGGAPVYATIPDHAETITSSGTSVQSAAADAPGYAGVTSDGAVFIAFGQNPTAASGSGYLIQAGASKDFGPLKRGDKVAVIDAA